MPEIFLVKNPKQVEISVTSFIKNFKNVKILPQLFIEYKQ